MWWAVGIQACLNLNLAAQKLTGRVSCNTRDVRFYDFKVIWNNRWSPVVIRHYSSINQQSRGVTTIPFETIQRSPAHLQKGCSLYGRDTVTRWQETTVNHPWSHIQLMDGWNITAFGKGNVITGGVFFFFFFERQTVRHRNQLFNLGHLRTSFQAVGKKNHCVLSHGWLRKSHVASQNTMWLTAGAFLMGGRKPFLVGLTGYTATSSVSVSLRGCLPRHQRIWRRQQLI